MVALWFVRRDRLLMKRFSSSGEEGVEMEKIITLIDSVDWTEGRGKNWDRMPLILWKGKGLPSGVTVSAKRTGVCSTLRGPKPSDLGSQIQVLC